MPSDDDEVDLIIGRNLYRELLELDGEGGLEAAFKDLIIDGNLYRELLELHGDFL